MIAYRVVIFNYLIKTGRSMLKAVYLDAKQNLLALFGWVLFAL
jgi:hypothetical protein